MGALPLMDYVSSPSRIRDYLKDPRSVYYYFNKAVRVPVLRQVFHQAIGLVLPKAEGSAKQTELARLRTDGLLQWTQLLDNAAVENIRSFLSTKPVYDLRDVDKKPIALASASTQHQMKLRYFPEDVVQCKELMRIANDPNILGLVNAYLGCKPTISIMEAWWTKAASQASDQLFQDDMYHRDVEDFKFIKLFIYLTDVGPDNGAHCFIRGSHTSPALTARKPISDKEAEHAFAAGDCKVITGKAGDGFLEDTWGVHRALPAKAGERLLFSVTYSLTPFNPQSPATPVGQNLFGVDSYTNRMYLR